MNGRFIKANVIWFTIGLLIIGIIYVVTGWVMKTSDRASRSHSRGVASIGTPTR